MKYLADLHVGDIKSTTAIIKMHEKGKVTIKLMGYGDVIAATPKKRDFSNIEVMEEVKSTEETKKLEESEVE